MDDSEPEYSDVLIIGAGISGIGAAYRITEQNPQLTLHDPGAARAHRRHLGPVPLSGHPLGQRHLHAELTRTSRGRGRRTWPRAPTSGTT